MHCLPLDSSTRKSESFFVLEGSKSDRPTPVVVNFLILSTFYRSRLVGYMHDRPVKSESLEKSWKRVIAFLQSGLKVDSDEASTLVELSWRALDDIRCAATKYCASVGDLYSVVSGLMPWLVDAIQQASWNASYTPENGIHLSSSQNWGPHVEIANSELDGVRGCESQLTAYNTLLTTMHMAASQGNDQLLLRVFLQSCSALSSAHLTASPWTLADRMAETCAYSFPFNDQQRRAMLDTFLPVLLKFNLMSDCRSTNITNIITRSLSLSDSQTSSLATVFLWKISSNVENLRFLAYSPGTLSAMIHHVKCRDSWVRSDTLANKSNEISLASWKNRVIEIVAAL